MPTLKNFFNRGIQDKDTDRSAVPQGVFRHAENLRFHTNNGHDGIGVNIRGSLEVSDSTDGRTDLKCITAIHDEDRDVIYYYLASTNGQFSKIVEYDINNDNTTDVLHDTLGVLNLDKDGYITGINEIDGLLYWAEWGKNPRRINVDRAKNYGTNGFTEDDIKVMVKPPAQKLKIELTSTDTISQEENNIEDKFLSFSYRYRYLDGEYSTLAPFTNFAFLPKKFEYDFAVQSNKSMINRFNQVDISFFTGSERVVEIQLVFKESGSNAVWVIDNFVKKRLQYQDNVIETFSFFNNKTFKALSQDILPNMFNNVPKTAKAQEIIDGRLIYGHYKENYDIVDNTGKEIELDYSLEAVHEPNTIDVQVQEYDEATDSLVTVTKQNPSLEPKRTVKSYRDYEVGMVYADDDIRNTTILNSKTNTIHIRNENSVTQNSIDVLLKHKPPFWAKYFRFFIKPNKKNYEQVIPTLFYQDGVYAWVKLGESDIDKIKKGDYLIVKSDSQGITNIAQKVKVLDVVSQDRNFLEPDEDNLKQLSGLYFKIRPENFRLNVDDIDIYEFSSFENNTSLENPIGTNINYIQQPIFYGTSLQNDLTSSGNYTHNEDLRYLVEIDDGISVPNTFKWSKDNGATFIQQNVAITQGIAQPLDNGVEITFDNDGGHNLEDKWYIGAKSRQDDNFGDDEDGWGYSVYKGSDTDIIKAGSIIEIVYDEYDDEYEFIEKTYISSKEYDNLEEWFYGDNIVADLGIPEHRIWFRRGNVTPYGGFNYPISGSSNFANGSQLNMTNDESGTMNLIIRSKGYENSNIDDDVKVNYSLKIKSSDNLIIFETEPQEQPNDIYFEVGKTYRIINGFHTNITDDYETDIDNFSTDLPQTASQDLRVKLDWFNAYSYGNAVESYKIRDEFNTNALDTGVRPLSNIKEKYKESTRSSDATWSDIYNNDSDFNGLNTFNLSNANFVTLDKEDGTIQKIHRDNNNLIFYQEDAIGLMPYNKNIIYDTQGGAVVGVANNILDKASYRPYANGIHGISLNPESFVAVGSRKYSTDRVRGDLLRLSINGVTEINQYLFEHWFSDEMDRNKGEHLIGGYDPKHKEYYLYMPKTGTLVFTEKAKGFPFFMTIQPDFMLNANNEFYAWKDGVMYKMNATENRNNFFKEQYNSVLKFFVNTQPTTEKIYKALGLESTHAWFCKLQTRLTSREIPKECFEKIEDYWYSEIMGNTNDNTQANSIFGLGSYTINAGKINTMNIPNAMCIGDFIVSKSLLFPPNEIIDIQGNEITLANPLTTVSSFLMYSKNQDADGSPIRGDILEIEMISDETEKVEIRSVRTEAIKSNFS